MTEWTAAARRQGAFGPALGAALLTGVLVAACAGSPASNPSVVAGGSAVGPSSGQVSTPPIPSTAASSLTTAAPSPASSTPSSSAAASEAASFHSDRYGYRLAVPAGWTATPNPGAGGVHPGDPGVDVFTDGRGNTLYIVAEPVPAGTSGDAWTSGVARHLEVDHGLTADGRTDVVVDGRPGRLIEYHLRFDPYVTHELVTQVIRGERGYAITLEGLDGRDADDRALLETLLAGFVFDA